MNNSAENMDGQTLVNILVEIAELEALQLQAAEKLKHNGELTFSLAELQAEYEQDAAAAARLNQGAQVTVQGLEKEIRQVAALLQVKKDRQVGLVDRRQARALQEEIRSLKARLDHLEDQTIELLDQQEQWRAEAVESGQESSVHGAQAKIRQEEMKKESDQLSRQGVHQVAELERLFSMLPKDVERTVRRLHEKLDQAVVHHHEGACEGCFHHLPRQQALDVDRGRTLIRCPSCMRYIVHRSWR